MYSFSLEETFDSSGGLIIASKSGRIFNDFVPYFSIKHAVDSLIFMSLVHLTFAVDSKFCKCHFWHYILGLFLQVEGHSQNKRLTKINQSTV